MTAENITRRPLKTRQTQWAAAAARGLVRVGVQPNQVSLFSVVCAGLAGTCLVLAPSEGMGWRIPLFIAAAVCIQLRLLCNLLDGMLAVEGGLRTKSGEIFNDLPDRVADGLIFVGAGYTLPWGSGVPALGWAAGFLAVLTAYVRVLGGATGVPQDFCGPMAKQHRMAVMTVACLGAAVEGMVGWNGQMITAALVVIIVGCVITIGRRTRRIMRALESR